jgi:hypothetical protein
MSDSTTPFLSPARLLAVAALVAQHENTLYDKTPYHTSKLAGKQYVDDLLSSGNSQRVIDVLRMPLETFFTLRDWCIEHDHLQPTRHISVEEQLVIFLKIVGENASNRIAQDRFQHSGETISRVFNTVLDAILKLYPEVVKQPSNDIVPVRIRNDSKMYPYFKGCIGAADGTHIHAHVHEHDMIRFRNRKGDISQNVLGICSFDELFCYVMPGWEGSAHDTRVLQAALGTDLNPPTGSYYLVDAGYGIRAGFLPPYRGVRYHLKEQHQSQRKPQNKEELFNLRHAQLRNVVERIFGTLKRRFRILRSPPEYPYTTQVKLVFALTALHNFIRLNNDNVELGTWKRNWTQEEDEDEDDDMETVGYGNRPEGEQEIGAEQMSELREGIAEHMWRDYNMYLERRRR